MDLAGVSVRRVEDITEALWGTRGSSGTVSRLNQKIDRPIEAWRTRRLDGTFPYLYLDGVVLKRSWAGEVRNVSVFVAIGVGADGHLQILGVAEGQKEELEGWRGVLRHLKERGLNRCAVDHLGRLSRAGRGGRRTVSRGAVAALRRAFYRNIFSHVLTDKVAEVARMLKAIHAQEDRRGAEHKVADVITKLRALRLAKVADLVETTAHETFTHVAFPSHHWRQMRTNNPLERIIREIRRRTRVVGAFPHVHSALMLVAARRRHLASHTWGKRRYLAMETLTHAVQEEAVTA